MSEPRKTIAELRAEVRSMMAAVQIAPSKMCRTELERMREVYGAAAERNKALPPAEKNKGGRPRTKEPEPPREKKVGGRKKAVEVEGAEKEGVVIPKKLDKPKTAYAEKQEKKKAATIKPGKLDDDSGTGSESEAEEKKAKVSAKKVEKAAVEPAASKPKRTLTEEQKAKMKAGREAKKTGGDAAAKPKKDDPPPDAPSKKEKPETKEEDAGYLRLPVFRLG